MPNDLNRVQLLARVGQDPEIRYTQGGSAILNMSVATNRTWKQDGEKRQQTNWHRIVIFGKLAETMGDMIKKGTRCFIEGSLETRKWDRDGTTHYTTEVIIRPYEGGVTLLSGFEARGSGGSGDSGRQSAAQEPAEPSDGFPFDDDVPF